MTAYVTTSGNLGLFLKADVPLSIRVMLEGKVKGNVINVAIPPQIQEPLPNVPSAIETLNFSLNGKTNVKGKTRGVVEYTGCSGGKWTLKFQNVMTDGSLSDKSASVLLGASGSSSRPTTSISERNMRSARRFT